MSPLSDVLRRYLRNGDTYFDIGAKNGTASVGLASQIVGSSGIVVATEPDPAGFMRLRSNVDQNNLGNVRCVQASLAANIYQLIAYASGRKPDLVRVNVVGCGEQIVRGLQDLIFGAHAPGILWAHARESDNAAMRRTEAWLLEAGYSFSTEREIQVALSPRLQERKINPRFAVSKVFAHWSFLGGREASLQAQV
jgi:hypothetical protein